MTTDPNDLTTLTTTLAWLGCQSDDAFGTLQRVITATSVEIQNIIGRNIKSASYVATFDGRGRSRIMMPNSPITAVASVSILLGATQVPIQPRSLGQPGFFWSDKFVYVDPPYRFEKGMQNVIISYTAGLATVPSDIEQACLTLVKTVMDSSNYSAALQKAKSGQTQLDFSFALTKLHGLTGIMPPAVFRSLAHYQRVAPAW